jgi:hypothetical protein
VSREVKGCWGRELATLHNFLREFSKAKHLAFLGRKRSYLKLLSGRPALKHKFGRYRKL